MRTLVFNFSSLILGSAITSVLELLDGLVGYDVMHPPCQVEEDGVHKGFLLNDEGEISNFAVRDSNSSIRKHRTPILLKPGLATVANRIKNYNDVSLMVEIFCRQQAASYNSLLAAAAAAGCL